MKQDMIVILDLGSHENTVVARAIRALGVYSEIYPHDITAAELKALPNVKGIIINGGPNNVIDGVAIDSRKIKEGQLFVPIIGAVHDAHKFLPQVYENGCRTFLVSDQEAGAAFADCNVILVDDTTKGMQLLAKYYLEKLNLKKITVTGSVGKTSTRDMVHSILSEKYKTGTTVGNLNSDYGVPLTGINHIANLNFLSNVNECMSKLVSL